MNNFSDFIRKLGYEPISEIIPDKWIRFGKKQSVSARLFPDGQGGYLHDWRTGERHLWFAEDRKSISPHEKQARQQDIALIKRAEESKQAIIHKEAGAKAKELFMTSPEALESHHYLVRKKVKPYDIRQQGDNLLIPIYSVLGEFQSLQYINTDGVKRFLKGGKTMGGCHFIGLLKMDSPIFIAEGYATAASIHKDTQCLSIVAFNASNLVPVAIELRKQLQTIQIVIAGDSDDVGRAYATKASQFVNGTIFIPDFGDNPNGLTDWNDFINERGSL